MQKILIIGSPGSGKSTLSRSIKVKLNLPLIHLDNIYWKPNWISISRDEFDEKLEIELKKDKWIIEGNYQRTLAYRLKFADTVIYLDYEPELCLDSYRKRVKEGILKSDMPQDCIETVDNDFEDYILNFRVNNQKLILDHLNSFKGNVIILKTREEANEFLNNP